MDLQVPLLAEYGRTLDAHGTPTDPGPPKRQQHHADADSHRQTRETHRSPRIFHTIQRFDTRNTARPAPLQRTARTLFRCVHQRLHRAEYPRLHRGGSFPRLARCVGGTARLWGRAPV